MVCKPGRKGATMVSAWLHWTDVVSGPTYQRDGRALFVRGVIATKTLYYSSYPHLFIIPSHTFPVPSTQVISRSVSQMPLCV